jgi:uncharacterized damage-inducible protein DinB
MAVSEPLPVERVDPDWAPDERTVLVQFLQWHRATLELKTHGLSDAAAATASCPPSILTLTGLVRHLAEVERNWFRRCFAGEDAPPLFYTDESPDGDLDVRPETSLAESLHAWRAEVEAGDAVLDGVADLGQLSTRERHGNRPNMRWILVHMIEEYGRHLGHADLIRERIDGVVGD